MKKVILIALLYIFVASAAYAQTVVSDLVYQMYDHPDGNLTNPGVVEYGARIDSLGGSAAERTFSTQSTFGSYLYWDSISGVSVLFGELSRNSDSSSWSYLYVYNTMATATGYESSMGYGLLEENATGQQYGLQGTAMGGPVFLAQGDGHRCGSVDCLRAPMDDWQEVARGWSNVYDIGVDTIDLDFSQLGLLLAVLLEGPQNLVGLGPIASSIAEAIDICLKETYEQCNITSGSNDWLVQLQPVPVPAALPLFLSGLLGVMMVSRRSKAA